MSLLRIRIGTPKTRAQLDALTNPTNARQPEVLPWVFYDTQAIATAAAGNVQYFAAVNSDKTLSNLEQAGTLADPQYFEIVAFGLDFLVIPELAGATALPGPLNDLSFLLHTSRATFVFSMNNKEYLRIPATFLTNSGGPAGVASTNMTVPNNYTFATNGIPGQGGFYVDKAIIIPPKQFFSARLELGAATVFSATRNVRIWMAGALYRRVL